MRKLTTLLVFVAVCATLSFASQETASLESLLQMRVAASGAIDTVLNLLEDLRKSAQNDRDELDKKNKTQEAEGQKLIADLSEILASAQQLYDNSVAHKKFLEKEHEEAEAHIEWIDNRLEEIKRKLGELKKQRCKANAMFVDSLKQHNDALKAIKILQSEITRLHQEGELTEISSLTDKFKAYEHLFEKESIQQFVDLSKETEADKITGFKDNNRGALKLENMDTKPQDRNLKGSLADKVLKKLEELAEHLKASMKNLAEHEIQAAYDYADFKAASEIENSTLRVDKVRKAKYVVKLDLELEEVELDVERNLELRDTAQENVNTAVAILEGKRAFYSTESDKVNADLQTIDDVIRIFKERVATLADELKQRVDQEQEGDTMTRIKRKTDEMKSVKG